MKINKLLEAFNKCNNILKDNDLAEISVVADEISLVFLNTNVLNITESIDLLRNDPLIKNGVDVRVTTEDRNMRICLSNYLDKTDMKGTSIFTPFIKAFEKVSDIVCTCPILEYIVSENYVKVYLDKPGLEVQQLVDLENFLSQKCTLELHNRPYALFIPGVSNDDE